MSLVDALAWASIFHVVNREWDMARALTDELVELGTRHDWPHYVAVGMFYRGAALVGQGHAAAGIAEMRKILYDWVRIGNRQLLQSMKIRLAAALGKTDRTEEALKLVCTALNRIDANGQRQLEAEAHRIAGELLLSLAGRQAEGEAHLLQALESAHRQCAKLFELRAATTLAGWWRDRGQLREARALLTPVYNWFTEGFDTADLKDAKALLKGLQ